MLKIKPRTPNKQKPQKKSRYTLPKRSAAKKASTKEVVESAAARKRPTTKSTTTTSTAAEIDSSVLQLTEVNPKPKRKYTKKIKEEPLTTSTTSQINTNDNEIKPSITIGSLTVPSITGIIKENLKAKGIDIDAATSNLVTTTTHETPMTTKKRIKSLTPSLKQRPDDSPTFFNHFHDQTAHEYEQGYKYSQTITPDDIKTDRKHIHSIFDLSYHQILDVFQQANILRYKVQPLKHMPTRQALGPQYLQPLKNMKTTLLHQFHGNKAQITKYNNDMIADANIPQIPMLLGAAQPQVFSTNGIDSQEIQIKTLKKILKKHNITSIVPNTSTGVTGQKHVQSIDTIDDISMVNLSQTLTPTQLQEFYNTYNETLCQKLLKNKNNVIFDVINLPKTAKDKDNVHPNNINSEDTIQSPDLVYLYSTTKQDIDYKPIVNALTMKANTSSTLNTNTDINNTPPTLSIATHRSSIVSLLSIFSLLPQTQLLTNPNTIKIAYLGLDYANHSFVAELIYLCQRFGVNLSLATPNNSTKTYNQNIIEQSQIAFNVPPPTTQPPTKTKRRIGENELDVIAYNNDGDISNAKHALLHPPLFFYDKSPGISPYIRDSDILYAYRDHLRNVEDNVSRVDSEWERSMKLLQDRKQQTLGHNPFTQKKTTTKKNTNTSQQKDPNAPQRPYDPIIEFVQHPFAAVQHADVVITNSVFCATTYILEEHPSYELDQEMLSFAKDNVQLFHMTEGYYPWKEPILGLHDPRDMFEKQTANESYILAALSMVLTDKKIM